MAVILFVMKYPLHQNDNLKPKFDGQMAAARALGYEAYGIGWDPEGMWLMGEGTRALLKRNRLTGMPGYDHTKIFMDLMAAVRAVLLKKRVDVLYLRYMPTFAGAQKILQKLKAQGGKLVVEYPTYPKEKGIKTSFWRGLVFSHTDRVMERIHPLVDLYTLIGEPCNGFLDGRPAMNIVNGVPVEGVTPHVPRPQDPSVSMLALASMAKCHGYDRVIKALGEYQGSAAVRIHMVGPDADGSLAEWKKLAETLGLQDRVIFHGPLYGQALDDVMAACDVGLGLFGLYRVGLSEATPLKLREYMARGIPFVNAGYDPGIPMDERFSLCLPNDASPISMERMVEFALRTKGDDEAPVAMRAYAREHMTWEGILEGVFARLEA